MLDYKIHENIVSKNLKLYVRVYGTCTVGKFIYSQSP